MRIRALYKLLGVNEGASQEEIRRAYKNLARKYHPDTNREDPKSEERFKEVQLAYEVLSSREKKREYNEGPSTFSDVDPSYSAGGDFDSGLAEASDHGSGAS